MKIKKKKRKKKADAMPAAKLKISILIKCTSSKARFFFFSSRAPMYILAYVSYEEQSSREGEMAGGRRAERAEIYR